LGACPLQCQPLTFKFVTAIGFPGLAVSKPLQRIPFFFTEDRRRAADRNQLVWVANAGSFLVAQVSPNGYNDSVQLSGICGFWLATVACNHRRG